MYSYTNGLLCTLICILMYKRTASSDVGTVCTGIGCQGRSGTNLWVDRMKARKQIKMTPLVK